MTLSDKLLLIALVYLNSVTFEVQNGPSHSVPSYGENFCKGNKELRSNFNHHLSAGYHVYIKKRLQAFSEIKVTLDSGGTVLLQNYSRFSATKDTINNIFTFIIVKDVDEVKFTVQGRHAPNHPPYIISLKIDGVENCKEPDRTYFQKFSIGVVKLYENAPDKFCGRRRINHRYTELIVSGSATKAGEYPYHAAILRLQKFTMKYVCGGTLISKYTVLTAGHCVSANGAQLNPNLFSVSLGKYTLVARDVALQEKEVYEVILHDGFDYRTLDNDIALLKLSSEAIFNNYVQPACIWFNGLYDHIGAYDIKGTVVGWGFDNTDSLSSQLKSAVMPLVTEITCIRFDPIFYSNVLNGKRFCAGTQNGTAACNGDSGGAFAIFVQDDPNTNYKGIDYIDGAWYVRGIVSVSLARHDASICNPDAYTIFTDVALYRDWILDNMN
ncbi:trypsin-1 isoform X2 [Bicyclus anynana]|nr:trypsin-1 isoform X2 [Bicyclus anynana]